jgi:hypothetical protein
MLLEKLLEAVERQPTVELGRRLEQALYDQGGWSVPEEGDPV